MRNIKTILKTNKVLFILVILSFSISLIVLISQTTASTPKIINKNGQVISGSIAKLERVQLGNSKQWITIRGRDITKPILLFLSGGPGGSQLVETRNHLAALEEHFIVVNWDQPGSGKSFSAVSKKELTPQRYVSDAHSLTEYLKKRFERDKIFILGQSWGSALGVWLIDKYPEDYYAFIGSGQMVAFQETEEICYQKALEIAELEGDSRIIEDLKKQGAPPYYGSGVVWKESKYLMYLSKYMEKNPNIYGPSYNTISDIMSSEYGLLDKVNYIKGMLSTFNNVYQQLYSYDLRKQNNVVEVPVYIMHGKHDLNAPIKLVEEYYELLKAPDKELVWFSNSGHSPWISETALFTKEFLRITNKVLSQ